MAYLTFFWWDYVLIFAIISCSIATGIYYGFFEKKKPTVTGDLYVERQMKVFPVAVSLIASTISLLDLLAVPAEIYMYGTQIWVEVLSILVAGFILNFVFLPVFFKLKLGNPYQYFEMRFSKNFRRILSFQLLVPMFLLITVFIYAPSLVFSQVSGIDTRLIAPIITLVCIFYTTVGGLKAVVWADTLQFSVTLCSLSVALVMGIASTGGFREIWKKAIKGNRIEFLNLNPDPIIRNSFWSVFIGNIFRWIAFVMGHPIAMQRLLSVSTPRDSRSVLIIFVIGMMITKSIMCFSGLIIYAKYFDCDPLSIGHIKNADQIVPYYVLDVVTQIPLLGTLFIAGLLSVGLSVLSSLLNVFSCTLYMDFLSSLMPSNISERSARNVMKIIIVTTGAICLCLVFIVDKLGSLLELPYILTGSTSGVRLGIFALGLLFPTANTKGVLYGGAVSVAFMLWLIIKTEIHRWNGVIKFEPQPLYTDGCNETVLNSTILTTNAPEEPFWLFKISFHYYFALGCLITMMIGFSISWTTRKNKHGSSVDPNLLSPIINSSKSTGRSRYEPVEYTLSLHGN